VNSNWQRWIAASIHKHFKDACDAGSMVYFIDSAPTDNQKNQLNAWVEGRIYGPIWNGGTKGENSAIIEVNMYLGVKTDAQDFYKAERLKGLLTVAFTTALPVFKLGDGIDDDPTSIVTCLNLVTSGREKLIVSNFGPVAVGVPVQQATVEGHFSGNFYE
jgi:hypothetical protein